jgi:hypothetical protein
VIIIFNLRDALNCYCQSERKCHTYCQDQLCETVSPKRINYHTTLILRTPRVLAEAVADVAARQLVTPSEFAQQPLLDKLSQLGIELRSLPPADRASAT